MNTSKIQKKLLKEIELTKKRGIALAESESIIEQHTFDINIQHKDKLLVIGKKQMTEIVDKLKSECDKCQTRLLGKISNFATPKVKPLFLSNSIATKLTSSQIKEISDDDDVKTITLEKKGTCYLH